MNELLKSINITIDDLNKGYVYKVVFDYYYYTRYIVLDLMGKSNLNTFDIASASR